MDLKKASNEEKLNICRKYYLAGFGLLPFLWAVNGIWFFKTAFFTPEFPQQKKIKSYVVQSLAGSILWLIVLITWVTLFQVYRTSWGEIADLISFIIPVNIV